MRLAVPRSTCSGDRVGQSLQLSCHRRRVTILRVALLLLSGLVGGSICSGCTDPARPRETVINLKLKRILGGEPVSNPVWTNPGTLFVYTGLVNDNGAVSGVFQLEIDPISFELRSTIPYEFPDYIWTLAYDVNLNRLVGISLSSGGLFHASHFRLVDGHVVADEDIASADWQPWGVSSWPGRNGILFYGTNPSTDLRGFYWHRPSQPDSLVYAVTLRDREARGFSVRNDGGELYYAHGDGGVVTFYGIDLVRPEASQRILAQRGATNGAIISHPVNANLVLLNYQFPGDAVNPPAGHIELLDLSNARAIDLNVRTLRFSSQFSRNDHPWWSPDGRHFAYSTGGFDGEGATYPMELWIYRDPP